MHVVLYPHILLYPVAEIAQLGKLARCFDIKCLLNSLKHVCFDGIQTRKTNVIKERITEVRGHFQFHCVELRLETYHILIYCMLDTFTENRQRMTKPPGLYMALFSKTF